MKNKIVIGFFSCILLVGLGLVIQEQIDPSGLARGRGGDRTPTDSAKEPRDTSRVWSHMHNHLIEIDQNVVLALIDAAEKHKVETEGAPLTEDNLQFVTALSPLSSVVSSDASNIDDVFSAAFLALRNVSMGAYSLSELQNHDKLKFMTSHELKEENLLYLDMKIRKDFAGSAFYIVRVIVSPLPNSIGTTTLKMRYLDEASKMTPPVAELSYTSQQAGQKLSLISEPIEISKEPTGEKKSKSFDLFVSAGAVEGSNTNFTRASGYIHSVELYRVLY